MKLTECYDVKSDGLDFAGEWLAVDLSFDVVLNVLGLLADGELEFGRKVEEVLALLVPDFAFWDCKLIDQCELFLLLVERFIVPTLEDKAESSGGQTKKAMDFDKDAGLIYASFYQAYGIDLFDMQGKLHWVKFQELLKHLPGETAFKEVVNYRLMAVPSTKEASRDYIDHVKKMKALYSLESDQELQQSNDDKLSALAARFGGDVDG